MAGLYPCDVSRLSALVAAGLMSIAATAAHAETGSANARDVSVHINLLGVATLDVNPQAPAGFSNAVGADYEQNTLPLLDVGGSLLHLSTGTLTSEAQYAPGVTFSVVGSDVDIQNLNLSAVSGLGDDLLSITADLIHASSQVTGWCLPAGRGSRAAQDVGDTMFLSGFDTGNLTPGIGGSPGAVVLGGLGISILGIPIPDLPPNPPPNTTIDLGGLGIVGATLILNESVVGGDGVTTSSLSTNALHLTLDVAGLITADVVLAHSDSMLDCTQ